MSTKPDRSPGLQRLEIKTSWGVITLKLEGGKVTECRLPCLEQAPHKPFALDEFQTLEDFLKTFPPIGTPPGSEFQRSVWDALREIPRGQTRTYGDIAKAIDRPNAVRAVGTACGANPLPLFIPCHRVVATSGLGGFGSGLPWKEMLLQLEGWNDGMVE